MSLSRVYFAVGLRYLRVFDRVDRNGSGRFHERVFVFGPPTPVTVPETLLKKR